MKQWLVYNYLLNPDYQDIEPIQPNYEDRIFLKRSPQPPMYPVGDFVGDKYNFSFREMILKNVIKLKTIDINFKALQYWLDHLGPAIYNPVYITLLLKENVNESQFIPSHNGAHRVRCLWELGYPYLRVMLRMAIKPELKGTERKEFEKWTRKVARTNFCKPTIPHFKINPDYTWKQYYPDITPLSQTLKDFFVQDKEDGYYYKDTLDTPMSIRDIISQNKKLSYRLTVIDNIMKTDFKDKTILDVGCYFGHYMFMLLEAGAKYGTGLEIHPLRWKVSREIAVRRGLYCNIYFLKAHEYLDMFDRKFNICLVLNVFHHLLKQDEKLGWKTMNRLLDRSDELYLMTQNVWGVFDKWDGNIEDAMKEMTGCNLKSLVKTRYRGRVLYRVTK